MRLAALSLIGGLGIGALGLAASAVSAQAAPLVPSAEHATANIVQVWGGCGPGGAPVPGHWRGPYWVPPHCRPVYHAWGPGPYWRWHHRYW